jgi:hypothetical protein
MDKENFYNDQTFLYILDLAQSLSIEDLEGLINNLQILIENKKEESEEK